MSEKKYTTVQISPEYREKLRQLASKAKRSMAAELEVLIDAARDKQKEADNA